MLQSNQPFQRVDDGIGSGLVGGAVVGGAIHGGVGGLIGFKGSKAMGGLEKVGEQHARAMERFTNTMGNPSFKKAFAVSSRAQEHVSRKMINSMDKGVLKNIAKHGYGSNKRRMISSGASVLGGALLGAGIDAAND
jgi:hypothetical protein